MKYSSWCIDCYILNWGVYEDRCKLEGNYLTAVHFYTNHTLPFPKIDYDTFAIFFMHIHLAKNDSNF